MTDLELEPFNATAQDDMSVSAGDDRSIRSDDASISSDRSSSTFHHQNPQHRQNRQRSVLGGQLPTACINYHGVNIYQAAAQGNLPLCVLLWGMATAKRVNPMNPDSQGNTPMHFAALAELPEVLGFLVQQGRHKKTQDNRLVDLRNEMGETPLLRAATVGQISTLKYLLDEGSDPFCTDRSGSTIFITLAKHGHIWGLHYVYSSLCDKFGYQCIRQLLLATDNYDNNVLDWASDLGDVNVLEYLIRRNVDPTRVNSSGRTALHLAAMSCRADAVRFLIKCGCDPLQQDRGKESPMSIAKATRHKALISAMSQKHKSGTFRIRRHQKGTFARKGGTESPTLSASPDCGALVGIPGGPLGPPTDIECGNTFTGSSPTCTNLTQGDYGDMGSTMMPCDLRDAGISLYSVNRHGDRRPHAVCRLKPSRLEYALLYALVVVGYWILTLCIPFYAWLVLVVVSIFAYRHACQSVQASESSMAVKQNKALSNRGFLQELLLAPEKCLGVYIGMVTTCVLFWLCSLRIGINNQFLSSLDSTGPGSVYLESLTSRNLRVPPIGAEFLDFGGLSGSTDDIPLFWAAFTGVILGAIIWAQLVWISTDPGTVYTRDEDFDMILDQSLIHLGPAPSQLYCRTAMVKKPLRSKYCAQTGLVIARMDHFCVWLNNSVGCRNHRMFILFLICQFGASTAFTIMLIRAINRELGLDHSACWGVSTLLNRLYFFPTTLCAVLSVVSLIIGALLVEQNINITKNITTNERVNRSRYPWMFDSAGQPFNHFDKGILRNVLEFWGVPGYGRDYYREFSSLSSQVGVKSAQEVPASPGSRKRMDLEKSEGTRDREKGDSPDRNYTPRGRTDDRFPLPPSSPGSPFDDKMLADNQQLQQPQSMLMTRFRQPTPWPSAAMSLSQDLGRITPQASSEVSLHFLGTPPNGPASPLVLTRAQEAQMQFEARVQQAIEMSNLPSGVGIVHPSKGLPIPDLPPCLSGHSSGVEGERRVIDWNAYPQPHQITTKNRTDPASPSRSDGRRVGMGCVGGACQGPGSPPRLTAGDTSAAVTTDRIPSPELFVKSPQLLGDSTGSEPQGEDLGPEPALRVNIPLVSRKDRRPDSARDAVSETSLYLERSRSAPSGRQQYPPSDPHFVRQAPVGLADLMQQTPAHSIFDDRAQRSVDLSIMDDDQMMTVFSEEALTGRRHYAAAAGSRRG